jgi:beta-lactamase class A
MATLFGLILRANSDAATAAQLGCTQNDAALALRILSWQQDRSCLPALLPTGTVVAHKTGVGPSHHSDAGIIYRDGAPRFILAAYADLIPTELPDGLPGRTAATAQIGRLCRACWDALA